MTPNITPHPFGFRRLDVHHGLATGRHHQDAQGDRGGVEHRGARAAEQPAVRREDLQRERAAHRRPASVFRIDGLRRVPEAVLRRAAAGFVGQRQRRRAPGPVRMSVRREGGRGRQVVRGRPERRAARHRVSEHVGLHVQQHAVHTQGVGVRRRRRLSGQLGRGTKLHQ